MPLKRPEFGPDDQHQLTHRKLRSRDCVFGLDLQFPGHAGGREPQPSQQDGDRSELRGS